MKTILALAVIAILVSIIAVSTLVVTENIDARTRVSGSVVPVSSSGFNTAVCGPDAIHICQTAG
ncbi:MAG: hypothetical protein WBL68_10010 [Nitrososphaeraceae archaeon]